MLPTARARCRRESCGSGRRRLCSCIDTSRASATTYSLKKAQHTMTPTFATNNVNITKLESYFIDGDFIAAQFYVDVEGHQEEASVKLAIDELKFYSKEIKILGSYPAHPFRTQK